MAGGRLVGAPQSRWRRGCGLREPLEERVRFDHEVNRNQIVSTAEWQHRRRCQPLKDLGKSLDLVRREVKHQVSVATSLDRGLKPHLQAGQSIVDGDELGSHLATSPRTRRRF